MTYFVMLENPSEIILERDSEADDFRNVFSSSLSAAQIHLPATETFLLPGLGCGLWNALPSLFAAGQTYQAGTERTRV